MTYSDIPPQPFSAIGAFFVFLVAALHIGVALLLFVYTFFIYVINTIYSPVTILFRLFSIIIPYTVLPFGVFFTIKFVIKKRNQKKKQQKQLSINENINHTISRQKQVDKSELELENQRQEFQNDHLYDGIIKSMQISPILLPIRNQKFEGYKDVCDAWTKYDIGTQDKMKQNQLFYRDIKQRQQKSIVQERQKQYITVQLAQKQKRNNNFKFDPEYKNKLRSYEGEYNYTQLKVPERKLKQILKIQNQNRNFQQLHQGTYAQDKLEASQNKPKQPIKQESTNVLSEKSKYKKLIDYIKNLKFS